MNTWKRTERVNQKKKTKKLPRDNRYYSIKKQQTDGRRINHEGR